MLSSVYTWEGCKISTSLGMGSVGDREQERHGSHDPGFRRMALFSFVLFDFFPLFGVLLLFLCICFSSWHMASRWSQANLTLVGNLPASAS